MVNPIALVMVMLGAILLGIGIYWFIKRSKIVGTTISILGFCVVAIPFVVSFILIH